LERCNAGSDATPAVGGFGDQHEVDVVVHQAPGETAHLRRSATFAQQLQIEPPVGIGEEYRQAAIAALGDVVSDTGDDDSG
jgi:hypothetical protein